MHFCLYQCMYKFTLSLYAPQGISRNTVCISGISHFYCLHCLPGATRLTLLCPGPCAHSFPCSSVLAQTMGKPQCGCVHRGLVFFSLSGSFGKLNVSGFWLTVYCTQWWPVWISDSIDDTSIHPRCLLASVVAVSWRAIDSLVMWPLPHHHSL